MNKELCMLLMGMPEQLEKEKIRSDERIKSAQIKAIKDIATAYFKRQTEYIFFW
jgi:hypothetical protein